MINTTKGGEGQKLLRNRIAEIRNTENITQEELAKMSKISRVALSSIENGTVPNGDTMLNIAKALNKKVEDIFYETNVNHT